MLSPQALLKMIVGRTLPTLRQDGPENESFLRGSRYGEPMLLSMVRKSHLLVDEGTYYIVNNAQTGIIEGTNTGFLITGPTAYLSNMEDPSNPASKSIYPDYLDLSVSAAGSTGTATQGKALSVYLTKGNNYSSGGTDLSAKIINVNPLGPPSTAKFYFGALTTTDPAVSKGTSRVIVGQRTYRMPVTASTAPDAVGDRLRLEFGSVESEATGAFGTTGALMANVYQTVLKIPPVVIPPGWSLHICTWDLVSGGTYGTGVTWLPEMAWWAR